MVSVAVFVRDLLHGIRTLKRSQHEQDRSDIRTLSTKIDNVEKQVSILRSGLTDRLTCQCHCQMVSPRILEESVVHQAKYDITGKEKHNSVGKQPVPKPCLSLEMSRKDFQRECMKKALQENVVILIENIPFTESELCDILIEQECLTGTECEDLRAIPGRKNKVRNLVRLIKGRSFDVLNTFLMCVKTFNPEIEHVIRQSYKDKLIKNSPTEGRWWMCSFCHLKESVDITLLADHLWAADCLSDDLYDDIVRAAADNKQLWDRVSDESKHNGKLFLDIVRKILKQKGHYEELLRKLSKEQHMQCTCAQLNNPRKLPIIESCESRSDDGTTYSPESTSSVQSQRDTRRHSILGLEVAPYSKHHNLFLSETLSFKHKYNSSYGVNKIERQHSEIDDGGRSRSNSFLSSRQLTRAWPTPTRRASMFV